MIANVSNAAVGLLSRASAARLQTELTRGQQELSSGRHHDVGLVLGSRSSVAASLRSQLAEADAYLHSNDAASARFSAIDTVLDSLTVIAQSMQKTLLSRGAGAAADTEISDEALAALGQLISNANTTFDGAYVLSGRGVVGPPLKEFSNAAVDGPGQTLIRAFRGRFGREPGDPANAGISAADLRSFLDEEFAQLFDADGWKANWANATDTSDEIRISASGTIVNSATAASPAIRDLVKSFAMIAGPGLETLNRDARDVLVSEATKALGDAIRELSELTAGVGLKRSRIADASTQLGAQQTQLRIRLDDLETVDPAEISIRMSTLTAQLQASYQVTVKLAQLSLANFV